jgi:hypothetical protein
MCKNLSVLYSCYVTWPTVSDFVFTFSWHSCPVSTLFNHIFSLYPLLSTVFYTIPHLILPCLCLEHICTPNIIRVCTHQQSQVQSSPVRLTTTQQWLCGITTAAAAVCTQQKVKSSPMSLTESRVLMLHVPFLSVRLHRSGRAYSFS